MLIPANLSFPPPLAGGGGGVVEVVECGGDDEVVVELTLFVVDEDGLLDVDVVVAVPGRHCE